jgi:hypothetical protein
MRYVIFVLLLATPVLYAKSGLIPDTDGSTIFTATLVKPFSIYNHAIEDIAALESPFNFLLFQPTDAEIPELVHTNHQIIPLELTYRESTFWTRDNYLPMRDESGVPFVLKSTRRNLRAGAYIHGEYISNYYEIPIEDGSTIFSGGDFIKNQEYTFCGIDRFSENDAQEISREQVEAELLRIAGDTELIILEGDSDSPITVPSFDTDMYLGILPNSPTELLLGDVALFERLLNDRFREIENKQIFGSERTVGEYYQSMLANVKETPRDFNPRVSYSEELKIIWLKIDLEIHRDRYIHIQERLNAMNEQLKALGFSTYRVPYSELLTTTNYVIVDHQTILFPHYEIPTIDEKMETVFRKWRVNLIPIKWPLTVDHGGLRCATNRVPFPERPVERLALSSCMAGNSPHIYLVFLLAMIWSLIPQRRNQ